MIQSPESAPSAYSIETFQSGDREAFLSLYETVFGLERSPEWFRWKYEENPYADHVAITMAKRNGTLVGCRSLFALEVCVDGERRVAYQPCDTMVHPDHRNRGLFTAMNAATLERYADGGPAFFFNFPNEQSKSGNVKFGWRPVGRVPMYYRPQNPVAAAQRWAETRVPEGVEDAIGFGGVPAQRIERALAASVTESHRTCDRLVAGSTPELRIERYGTPPAETLEAVAERSAADAIRVARSARYYRWRLANPTQEYATYVAVRNGTPVAAIVVSHADEHTRIVETLPRAADAEVEAIERLLVSVLADCRDRSYLTAFGDALPRPVRYRFYPDTQPPLSTVIRPTTRTLYVRDLESELGVADRSVEDWTLSRLDLDTG